MCENHQNKQIPIIKLSLRDEIIFAEARGILHKLIT